MPQPLYTSLKAILFLTFLAHILSTGTRPPFAHQLPNTTTTASPPTSLTLNGPYLTVYVDFIDSHAGFYSNKTNVLGGNMAVALYSSDTLIGGDCSSFIPYNCSNYECHPDYDDIRNISYPFLDVSGYSIYTPLFLDYENFFNYQMDVLYAQTCSEGSAFGDKSVFGVIGMGTEGAAESNFALHSPTFSIYTNNDSTSAELSFDCDVNKRAQDGTNITLLSNRNWEINISDVKMVTSESTKSLTSADPVMAIFDINTPYIGLPSQIFDLILDSLLKAYNVSCETNTETFPLACNYSGEITHLPSFQVNDIEVSPRLYLTAIKNSTYHLSFVSLSSESLKKQPYQKVSAKYSNHIILGRSFFQEFYVCFEANDDTNQISVYKKGFSQVENSKWPLAAYITLGIFISIPVIFFIIFCIRGMMKRKDSKKTEKFDLTTDHTEFFMSIDSSLLSSPRGPASPRMATSPRGFATSPKRLVMSPRMATSPQKYASPYTFRRIETSPTQEKQT